MQILVKLRFKQVMSTDGGTDRCMCVVHLLEHAGRDGLHHPHSARAVGVQDLLKLRDGLLRNGADRLHACKSQRVIRQG